MVRIATLLAMIGVTVSGCSSPSNFPKTPLFANLEGLSYEEGQSVLRHRVDAKFRVGSSEGELADYLRSQGLRVRRITTSGAPGSPIFGQSDARTGGYCEKIVRVDWRATAQQRITELMVSYGDTGCL